jgi:hypothetical protein
MPSSFVQYPFWLLKPLALWIHEHYWRFFYSSPSIGFIMWRSPFRWTIFFPLWLSWFWPPPTMRLNGLVPEMVGSIGHRSAPRIEWDSILLWWMGKVVTSAVLSQAVRCTKRGGLDEAILSSTSYLPWGFFLSQESSRTLCTCSLYELSILGHSGSLHRNLWIGSYKLIW